MNFVGSSTVKFKVTRKCCDVSSCCAHWFTSIFGFNQAKFFVMLLNSAAIMVYVERKVAAVLQQRLGPYLVGPRGLLQPLADIIKLMFKEELRPGGADRWLFLAAPIISAACGASRPWF